MTAAPAPRRHALQARRRRAVETARAAARCASALVTSRLRGRPLAPAAVLAEACQDLGATYVKLGQLVGSAPGVFGAAVSDPFRRLLDTGPPVPFHDVVAIVEEDLGAPLHSLFADFDEAPIAAASIAVVHRATLHTGESVAVKILRPGVATLVEADTSFLLPVITFLARQGIETIAPLHAFFSGLRQQIAEELDLRREADAMIRFRRTFEDAGLDVIVVPLVYSDLSSSRVLTMEFLDGVPIDDPATTDWGDANPRLLLLAFLNAWFTTAIAEGVFHGDLHAGNLMLLRDGRLGLIDWGILGRLDHLTHWLFQRMIEACLGDPTGWRDVAEGYRHAGVSMQDDFGLTSRAAAGIAQRQLEPVLTQPIGEVDLATLVVTSRDVAAAAKEVPARPSDHKETLRERTHRRRIARRFWRRLVDNGVRDTPFDRANFMLGKQLMYVERFGRMYLPDVPLINDRAFLRELLDANALDSPLTAERA